ncbi:thioesterase family protein [Pseudomonas piscis]|uniref:thioesterase family protein n=1 Tax=Pseudomonas piscis TaxID=2614538 RepID=UPI0003B73F69|nr:thioesterase family protein [Pseudomonas piscis]ERO64160.1 hypothetical protein P308_02615 [Pseudomonas piscis]
MNSLALTLDTIAVNTPCAFPSSWLQGRTAYGGLSAAMALQLVMKEHPADLPPLRTAQISFIGPVTESVCFRTELLRRGKSVTQIGVDAHVADALAMRASFCFAAERQSTIHHMRAQRPDIGPPSLYEHPMAWANPPGFFQNFEVRFVGDSIPDSSSTVPELLAWVRLHDADGIKPDVALIAIGDSLPPASMAMFAGPTPISSMNWTIDLVGPVPEPGWLLLRSRSLAASNGYSFQLMEVWDIHGNLVMLSTQTVAIFG